MKDHNVEKHYFQKGFMFLREDGILEVVTIDAVNITPSDMDEMINLAGKVTGGDKVKQLFMVGKLTVPNLESIEKILKPDTARFATAYAFVIQSKIQTIIGKFLTNAKNKPVPIKYFSAKESAVDWLQQLN